MLTWGNRFASAGPQGPLRASKTPLTFGPAIGTVSGNPAGWGFQNLPWSMGSNPPSIETGDPRRGTFATGATRRSGSGIGSVIGNLGKTVGPNSANPRINTAQIEGQTGFQNALSQMGSDLLNGIASSNRGGAQAQPASWADGEEGFDWLTAALIAAGAFGIYYIAKDM
ncbi:hypothetical protein [Rhodophyticola sp.]|jgi:hypothetical protein|uniref:hypothetical protein n=1 Tax=Rhodophyticola sp. TaxID=2680032 RepID=UPI003D2E0944